MISTLSHTEMAVLLVHSGKRKPLKKTANRKVSQVSKAPEAPEHLQDPAFVGTSGWAHASWKPGFYPQAVPQRKFLEYYATQLNSVEVNYTFRQLPTGACLQIGWPRAAPAFASRSKRRSRSPTAFASRTPQKQLRPYPTHSLQ